MEEVEVELAAESLRIGVGMQLCGLPEWDTDLSPRKRRGSPVDDGRSSKRR